MVKIDKLKITSASKCLVDLSMNISKSTALVGQSGSGKSLTLKAILGMTPSSLKTTLDIESPFDLIRGDTLSFVPQNPFTALSPLTKISKQFYTDKSSIKEIFDMLSLEWRLYSEYPANLSGGQLQRVIFAISLVNRPKLLLLDEPTTALDASLRDEMVSIVKSLQDKLDFSILFVTHDINLASTLCEDMVVLKNGSVVESGSSRDLLINSKEDYTKLLIESNFINREYRQ